MSETTSDTTPPTATTPSVGAAESSGPGAVNTAHGDAGEAASAEAAEAAAPTTAAGRRRRARAPLTPEQRRDRWSRVGAAVAAGLLTWLMVPNFSHWWLGFVALVPWMWAIDAQSPRAAFVYGYITGVVAVFLGFFWMTELLTRFAQMPLAVAAGVHFLFALWQGLMWAIPAALVALAQRRSAADVLWLAPPAWVVSEAFLPQLFPSTISLAWIEHPALLQSAELGGVQAVTFLMVAINAALFGIARGLWRDGAPPRLHAIASVLLLVGVPSLGTLRMTQIDAVAATRPTLDVGVVQGNFGIVTYAHPETRPLLLPEMQRVTAELEAKGADLAVWGETAYPYSAFGRDTKTDLPEKDRRRIRRGFDIPVAVGLVTRDKSGRNPYPWNSAIVVHPDDTIGDRYDKVYPLMFGEWVPFVDPEWYLETIPGASYINIGDGPRVLRVDDWRFGPLICYEDILPRYARWVASQDVHAFLNFTNDSWFGRSAEQTEHLGLAVFRAIEHRRSLIRSVNAGVSAYVDPAGRIVQRTNVTDADVDGYQGAEGFVATIPMMDPKHRTIFAMTGEAFPVACLVLVVVLALRRRSTTPEPVTSAS